jgi:G3E family GTPase
VHDEHCDHDHGHDHHHHDHGHDHGHVHDHAAEAGIKGISLTADKPLDGIRVTNWLNQLLAEKGVDILRAKGIIDIKGDDRRLVFQAVHMILEGDYQRPWTDKDQRYSRMVFIGRDLDEAALKAGFASCIA